MMSPNRLGAALADPPRRPSLPLAPRRRARKVAPRTRLGRCAFREFFRSGVGCRMLVEANNLLARSSQLEIPSPLSSRPQ